MLHYIGYLYQYLHIHDIHDGYYPHSVNSINTGTITPIKALRLGEAKMAATTTNVVNSLSTIFPRYLLFLKKTVSQTRL